MTARLQNGQIFANQKEAGFSPRSARSQTAPTSHRPRLQVTDRAYSLGLIIQQCGSEPFFWHSYFGAPAHAWRKAACCLMRTTAIRPANPGQTASIVLFPPAHL